MFWGGGRLRAFIPSPNGWVVKEEMHEKWLAQEFHVSDWKILQLSGRKEEDIMAAWMQCQMASTQDSKSRFNLSICFL